MNVLRIILGFIIGMVVLNLVAESIEFITVKTISGRTFKYLSTNQSEYFEIRNQPGILAFKMVYNFIASVTAGFLAGWIGGKRSKIAIYLLITFLTIAFIWAGFFSELSKTGPMWMWIALMLLTPVGLLAGHGLKSRKIDSQE